MAKKNNVPTCLGHYDRGDTVCDGDPESSVEDDRKVCFWRDRCGGFKMHLESSGESIDKYVTFPDEDHATVPDRETFAEFCQKKADAFKIVDGLPSEDEDEDEDEEDFSDLEDEGEDDDGEEDEDEDEGEEDEDEDEGEEDEDADEEDADEEDAGEEDADEEDAGEEDADEEDAGEEDAGEEDADEEDADEEDAVSTDHDGDNDNDNDGEEAEDAEDPDAEDNDDLDHGDGDNGEEDGVEDDLDVNGDNGEDNDGEDNDAGEASTDDAAPSKPARKASVKKKKAKKRKSTAKKKPKGERETNSKWAAQQRRESLALYLHFEEALSEGLNGYAFTEAKQAPLPGELYVADRRELSGYVSVYCKTGGGRDIPVVSIKLRPRLTEIDVDLPVTVKMLRARLSKAKLAKLTLKQLKGGVFRARIVGLDKEKAAIVAEVVHELVKTKAINLPSPLWA